MMKKIVLSLSFFIVNLFTAQYEGKIGINTDTPDARLTIQSSGNTNDTSALSLKNASNREFFKIQNGNGFVGIGTTSPLAPIHIYASQNSDIKIEALSFQIAGKTYIPNFQHMGHQGAGQYSNGNFGGQLFIFDIVLADVYNDNNDRAIWFKPDNENIPSAGVYISKGKYNGFSVGSNPTAKIDIGGSIRLRESQDALITGSDCTGRNGEIGYFKGHFYGCKNNSWVQIDN